MVLPWLLHSYGVGGSLLLLSLLQLTGAVRLSLVLVKAMYSHGARGGNLLLLKEEASCSSLAQLLKEFPPVAPTRGRRLHGVFGVYGTAR